MGRLRPNRIERCAGWTTRGTLLQCEGRSTFALCILGPFGRFWCSYYPSPDACRHILRKGKEYTSRDRRVEVVNSVVLLKERLDAAPGDEGPLAPTGGHPTLVEEEDEEEYDKGAARRARNQLKR